MMDLVFTDNDSNVYMLWREMSEVENIGEFGEFIFNLSNFPYWSFTNL